MHRWRAIALERKTLGKLKNFDAFINALDSDKAKAILGYKVGDDRFQLEHKIVEVKGKKHVVLYDPKFVDEFQDSNQWNVDATYKGVPKYDKKLQLLTIMGNRFGKVSEGLSKTQIWLNN